MPVHPVFSGPYSCPKCGQEYAVDSADESEMVCRDCGEPLEPDDDGEPN